MTAMSPTLIVTSQGGGVQLSVMSLTASEVAFDRMPNCAIFTGSRWKPPRLYDHLERLKDRLSLLLCVVDNGWSLRKDVRILTEDPWLRLLDRGWPGSA